VQFSESAAHPRPVGGYLHADIRSSAHGGLFTFIIAIKRKGFEIASGKICSRPENIGFYEF
jgi:hypothetical protein